MSRKHIFPKATYAHPNLRQQRAQLEPKKCSRSLAGKPKHCLRTRFANIFEDPLTLFLELLCILTLHKRNCSTIPVKGSTQPTLKTRRGPRLIAQVSTNDAVLRLGIRTV